MSVFRPMLAASVDRSELNKLRYPILVTPKIDGIRCLTIPVSGAEATAGDTTDVSRPISRSLKSIPNNFIHRTLAITCPPYCDGELVAIREDGSPVPFCDTSSAIMSRGGHPEFKYMVFDYFEIEHADYETRLNGLMRLKLPSCCELVLPLKVGDAETLLAAHERYLAQGWEGTCLRTPESPYKRGRSTLREQWLVKLKDFEDGEAVVLGYEPRWHNQNEAVRNELGYLERSSHGANMVSDEAVGALIVRDLKTDQKFKVGTGFNEEQRIALFKRFDTEVLGRKIKYRWQRHGSKDKPRIPAFAGFCDDH